MFLGTFFGSLQNHNEVNKASISILQMKKFRFIADIFQVHFCAELLMGRTEMRGVTGLREKIWNDIEEYPSMD